MKTKKIFGWFQVVLLCLLLGISSCSSGGSQTDTPTDVPGPGGDFPGDISLKQFADCNQMLEQFKYWMNDEVERYLESKRGICRSMAAGDTAIADMSIVPADSALTGEGSSPVNFTTTNVQETSVDEADFLKTDGQYIYAITGWDVKIIPVPSGNYEEFEGIGEVRNYTPISMIHSPNAAPTGMFLADQKLILISSNTHQSSMTDLAAVTDYVEAANQFVEVAVYDISDRSAPALIRRNQYSGELLGARMIGQKVHVIVSYPIRLPSLNVGLLEISYESLPECNDNGSAEPNEAVLDAIERTRQLNRSVIDDLRIEDIALQAPDEREKFCSSVYWNNAQRNIFAGAQMLTIVSDDVSLNDQTAQKLSLLGGGGAVYSSDKALYLASERYIHANCQEFNPVLLSEINNAECENEKTIVHRFSLDGGNPTYTGTNEIDGHVMSNDFAGTRNSNRFSMSQFAMSEHNGYLRVATTIGYFGETKNKIVVLDAASAQLDKVGEVGDLADRQTIYSVRFIDDKGYIVTFDRIDPLYVVDLSDPRSPKIAGELHVPGYSTYLHPVGDGKLIGLGFDTKDMMGMGIEPYGLKLSLFDVSQPTSPSELGRRVLGEFGTYSPATEEHHAFTFDFERKLLALPVEIYEVENDYDWYGRSVFIETMIFRVDGTGNFETVGEIELDDMDRDDGMWQRMSASNPSRTLFIKNTAYDMIVSLYNDSIFINKLDDGMTPLARY